MPTGFNADGEAVAAKDFPYAGVTYKEDEVFPYKKLGLAPVELHGQFTAGNIYFTGRPYGEPEKKPKR